VGKRRVTCRNCGRAEREVGRISLTGLCVDCASAAMIENVNGLRAQSGPVHQRWLEGTAAWLERVRSS
jgi:hypothetical protein